MTQLNASLNHASANSYLGTHVTVDVGDGQTLIGDVTAVDATGATPKIVVNGKSYGVASVLRVELPPLSSNTTTTPSP
jgi:hypothetical protein